METDCYNQSYAQMKCLKNTFKKAKAMSNVYFRYEVMKQCWCLNASDRLTFDEVVLTIVRDRVKFHFS